MGKWMQLAPADDPRHEIAGVSPHCVVYAGDMLRDHRASFPVLWRVRVQSKAYVAQKQSLTPAEASALLEELRRLRRICAGEEWLARVDPRELYAKWRESVWHWSPQGWELEHHAPSVFEPWLDAVEELLERAVLEDVVVVLML